MTGLSPDGEETWCEDVEINSEDTVNDTDVTCVTLLQIKATMVTLICIASGLEIPAHKEQKAAVL